MSKIFSSIGIALLILAIALPLMNIIPAGVAVGIAVPGVTITLLGWLFGRTSLPAKAETKVVQTIFSADKKFRADIKQRSDGKFQVETWKLSDYYEPDSGYNWIRQASSAITDSQAEAMDIASSYLPR